MSEDGDRFADLGPERDAGAERRRAIGEQLAERDRTHPEPGPERPQVPQPGNKYLWLVGILMLMGLGVLLFRTALPHTGAGLEGPRAGTRLPAFAAPSATGSVEGDANVCQKRPCGEQAGPIPACEVRAAGVVNVCELRRRPLVLTFVFDRGADCLPQVDRVERVKAGLPRVRFATVFFTHKPRDELSAIVRRRAWAEPVAVDKDGAVANLYSVGGCPTTVFARAGGRVAVTKLGNLTEDEIRREALALVGRR